MKISSTVISFYRWGNWGTGRLNNLCQLKELVRGGARPQGLTLENKLLAWPLSCCQSCGAEEQSPLKDLLLFLHLSPTSLISWPNDLAYSGLPPKALFLSLQILVEEEPLHSLFSPVRQEVFVTITDLRWHPRALYTCILVLHSGPIAKPTDMFHIFNFSKLFREVETKSMFCIRTLISRMLPLVSERPYWNLLWVRFCPKYIQWKVTTMSVSWQSATVQEIWKGCLLFTFLGSSYCTLSD